MAQTDRFIRTLWMCSVGLPIPVVAFHTHIRGRLSAVATTPEIGVAVAFSAVLIAAYIALVYFQWNRETLAPRGTVVWAMLVGSFCCTAIGCVVSKPSAIVLGWLLAVGCWLMVHRRAGSCQCFGLLYLWPLLWIGVRLPVGIEASMIERFDRSVAVLSGFAFDNIGIPYRLSGHSFHFANRELAMDKVSAGTDPVLWIVFISLCVVASLNRPTILLPLYLAAAIFWAFVAKISSIVSIAAAYFLYQCDLTSGFANLAVNYVCLFFAVAMLFSTDRLYRVIFFPVPREHEHRELIANPFNGVWNFCLGSMATGASHAFSSRNSIASQTK